MIAASALRSPHEAAERGQSTWVVSESDAAPAARPYLSTQVDAGKAGRRFVRRSASAFNMRIGCRYEPYVPNPPELPLPLGMVYPVNEIVRVDYFLPGCPPSGDAIWKFLTDLILGRMPRLDYSLLNYD